MEISTEPGIPCLPVPSLGRWLATAFDFVSVHFDVTRLIRTAQMLRKERARGLSRDHGKSCSPLPLLMPFDAVGGGLDESSLYFIIA